MTIPRFDPNTVFLGGERIQIGDLAASETIRPGMLVERFNNAGVIRFRKHSTAAGPCDLVATDHMMVNRGVDDDYLVNDLMEVSAAQSGSTWWMLIASGANIGAGDKLESAGNGLLRAVTGATPFGIAMENKPTVTVQTRIRVEKL